MKITKSKLAQLIKEELDAVLEAWKTAGQWAKTRGQGTGPKPGAPGEPAAIAKEREKEEKHASPLCQAARDEMQNLATDVAKSLKSMRKIHRAGEGLEKKIKVARDGAATSYKFFIKRAETHRKEQEAEGCIDDKDLAGIKYMKKKAPRPVPAQLDLFADKPPKPPVTAATAQKGIDKELGRKVKKPGRVRRPVGVKRRRRRPALSPSDLM